MKKLSILLSLVLIIFSNNLKSQSPVYFDPPAVEAAVAPNSTAVVHSVLHNATEDSIEFFFPGYTLKGQGGPDNFGYSWIDSDEAGGPDWGWTDISENGILIEGLGDDIVVGPFELDIDFPFYGQDKNSFWVSSNGCISFNDQFIPFANSPIPTNNNFVDFIAWFWDDLTIDTALTSVYFKNFEEKTVIQFNKMVHYPGTESFITAQVILINNGAILVRYKQVSENFETTGATVGIQSNDPELGLQVVNNSEYIHSELAVRFELNRSFITSVSPASFYLPPNTQETIWITYSSEGFESGNYEQDLKCITSLPEIQQVLLHNVMHVTNPASAGFKGYVTDAATGNAIVEAKVQIGEQFVFTNENGFYELPKEQGSYDVKFTRNGYQTLIVEDTTALPGFSILDVELEGYYFIAGRVFAGENYLESGFAYGYKMIEDEVVDIYAELTGEEGWYKFSGLAPAGYIIKAEPSPYSMYYGDFLPTYYGDVLHWEEATMINLPQSTDDAHINLVAVVSAPEGPCSISGIIQNSSRTSDVPIILRTTNPDAVVMTQSAADGSYSFTNLAYGTYEIFAEIPGKSVIPMTITLDESHQDIQGVGMSIVGDQIIIMLGIEESKVFAAIPFIYPIPAQERINVAVSIKKPSLVNIDIIDPSGRILSAFSYYLTDQKDIVIDLNSLSGGVYLLKIEAKNEVIMKRIIKN